MKGYFYFKKIDKNCYVAYFRGTNNRINVRHHEPLLAFHNPKMGYDYLLREWQTIKYFK